MKQSEKYASFSVFKLCVGCWIDSCFALFGCWLIESLGIYQLSLQSLAPGTYQHSEIMHLCLALRDILTMGNCSQLAKFALLTLPWVDTMVFNMLLSNKIETLGVYSFAVSK